MSNVSQRVSPAGETEPNAKKPSRPWIPALIAGAVALLIWFYVEQVHEDLFPKRFHTVVEGQIYRSGKLTTAAMTKVVRQHDIRTVVDFGAYPLGSKEDQLQQAIADSLGTVRYRFDLHGDATGNPNAYIHALRLMTDPANHPILVHCGAGTERTGCVVILYRHLVEGVPVAEGYKEASSIGHSGRRNPHLMDVLNTWTDPITEAWASGGDVPGAEPLPTPAPVGTPISSR